MSDEPIFTRDPHNTYRSRRRRARRVLIPAADDARAAFLEGMARRAYPSVEFFVFALLGGAVIGAGYLLNSPGLLMAGALLASLMAPWVGLCLASVTGSLRYFLQALVSLLVGGALILLTSLVAGYAAQLWVPLPVSHALQHARLWWPDLVLVAFGAVLLVVSFARSENRPVLPGVILAYEFYLPLAAAGFGLASGEPGLWPQGLLVMVVHLALATVLGLITLIVLRFRPQRAVGYGLTGCLIVISLVALVLLTGFGALFIQEIGIGTPAPGTASLPSVTPVTPSSVAGTPTPEPSRTPSPEPTLPDTPTPTATPIYAAINAQGFDSAIVRAAAGFNSPEVTGLRNGSLVIILPESETIDGIIWIHIFLPQSNQDGWVLQSVLILTTPTPNP